MEENRLCKMLSIRYPIVQGGMAWCSGAKLAAAVSEAGGLGLIGGGSMSPELFREHIQKARRLTSKPVGVNIPLSFKQADGLAKVALEEKVPVVFLSAGSPYKYTEKFKANGARVFHVVSNPDHAVKCEQAGVDGVVAEGFESGGHNGREELTTMVLTALVARTVKIPVLAAGGIATGRQMLAAFALGAEGVQVGTRFALTQESSAHENFKKFCLQAGWDATLLVLKKIIPVRMMKTPFFQKVVEAEARGASREELLQLVGEGRPRRGMFEGDLEDGILEIGQTVALVNDLPTCAEVIHSMVKEYEEARAGLPPLAAEVPANLPEKETCQ